MGAPSLTTEIFFALSLAIAFCEVHMANCVHLVDFNHPYRFMAVRGRTEEVKGGRKK